MHFQGWSDMANFQKHGRNVHGQVLPATTQQFELGLWGPIDTRTSTELSVSISPPNPAVRIQRAGMVPGQNVRVWQFTGLPAGRTLVEAKDSGGAVWSSVTLEIKTARTGPRFGNDGSIPSQHMGRVREAIETAWKLNDRPDFVETFRDTVSTLSGKSLSADIYAATLNKMVINLADTSSDGRIAKAMAAEAQDIQAGALSGPSPAFSFPNGTHIWIRTFSLAGGVRAVVANIIHEGAHLAGAPGNAVAEFALDVIHKRAGFPR
jgi:hypothetical protein